MRGPVLARLLAGKDRALEQPLRGNERHGHPERLLRNRRAYRRGGLKTVWLTVGPA